MFGISNEANMRSLFLSALMLIKVDYRHLKPKLKFVRKEELDILQKVIFEMTDAINDEKENLEACNDDEDGRKYFDYVFK